MTGSGMANQPSPDEMREEIIESHPDQWKTFDPEPTWVLKSNRDLSIRLLNRNPHEDHKIDQPDWAPLPNPTTAKDKLRVEFRGAPIDQYPVIQLDEYRVTMVYPDREIDEEAGEVEGLFLTEYEAHLSRIMSMHDFDQKLNQMDVTIR